MTGVISGAMIALALYKYRSALKMLFKNLIPYFRNRNFATVEEKAVSRDSEEAGLDMQR